MSIRTAQPNESEREFDRIARERGDVHCINVSPYTARFEMATAPGSAPRFIRVDPGGSTMIPHGYTTEIPGAGKFMLPSALDALTTREAWPAGPRLIDGRDNPFSCAAGPRLPMVVPVERATEMKAKWDGALASKSTAQNAPLKFMLQRTDGTRVEVDADVVMAPAQAPTAPDDDAMVRAIADDDPDAMEPAVLPSAPLPHPAPATASIPTKAEAAAKSTKGALR